MTSVSNNCASFLATAADFDAWLARWNWDWKRDKTGPDTLAKSLLAGKDQVYEGAKRNKDGEQLITLSLSSTNIPAEPILATEFLEVKWTQEKGFAAFASKDIECGTTILVEEALLEATDVNIFDAFDSLTTGEKEEYLKLSSFDELHESKIVSVFMTNRFTTSKGKCGIFLVASRFNHACRPNQTCSYSWDDKARSLHVKANKFIKQGSEITISYTDIREHLYWNYGFFCTCDSCPPVEEAARTHARLFPNGYRAGSSGW